MLLSLKRSIPKHLALDVKPYGATKEDVQARQKLLKEISEPNQSIDYYEGSLHKLPLDSSNKVYWIKYLIPVVRAAAVEAYNGNIFYCSMFYNPASGEIIRVRNMPVELYHESRRGYYRLNGTIANVPLVRQDKSLFRSKDHRCETFAIDGNSYMNSSKAIMLAMDGYQAIDGRWYSGEKINDKINGTQQKKVKKILSTQAVDSLIEAKEQGKSIVILNPSRVELSVHSLNEKEKIQREILRKEGYIYPPMTVRLTMYDKNGELITASIRKNGDRGNYKFKVIQENLTDAWYNYVFPTVDFYKISGRNPLLNFELNSEALSNLYEKTDAFLSDRSIKQKVSERLNNYLYLEKFNGDPSQAIIMGTNSNPRFAVWYVSQIM